MPYAVLGGNPHLSSDSEFVEAIGRGSSQGQLDGKGVRLALYALYGAERDLGIYGLEAASEADAVRLEDSLRGIWAHNVSLDRARVHRGNLVLVVAWHDGVSLDCWEAVNSGIAERLVAPDRGNEFRADSRTRAKGHEGVFNVIWIALLPGIAVVCGILLVRQGERWGSTPEERAQVIPGDEYLEGGIRARVAMTRAVSIREAPEKVWPWVAQLGRGAGWYSIDRLDNANRISAQHIVSWIPEPQLGDATAIGYLRHIDLGRSLAWWADGARFFGARTRLVTSYVLEPDGSETRLVSRMSADATGITAGLAICVFRVVDSVMATRQLIGIRDRVESCKARTPQPPIDPESGARDQFQVYEVLYADGETAGIQGKEDGARWRRAAAEDGVLEE